MRARRAKRVGFRVVAVVLGVLLALGAAELLLRSRILPLPPRLSQALFRCYGELSYTEPTLRVVLHRPHAEARCSSHGYDWRHRSDAYGFRNPATWDSTDVVLIGDSFIYGHGVEEHHTVAHFLREELDARVTNLGRTAASFPEYLAYLRNFALPLEPRVVVVFAFCNDFTDLRGRRTPAQIRRFLERGEAPEAAVLPLEALLATGARQEPPPFWSSLAVVRAAAYVRRELETPPRPGALGGPAAKEKASADAPAPFAEQYAPELAYMERALALMAESTAAAGSQLVLSRIQCQPRMKRMYRANAPLGAALDEVARRLQVPFFDPPLAGPDGKALPGTRLARDGHLSEAGHRLLARSLAGFLREQGLSVDGR